MKKAVCRFTFPKGTAREVIETAITSAVFNAECVFGKPRVRVAGVSYFLAEDNGHCVIDVSTDVGEHVAQVFTGIMMRNLGDDKFQVRRMDGLTGGLLSRGRLRVEP